MIKIFPNFMNSNLVLKQGSCNFKRASPKVEFKMSGFDMGRPIVNQLTYNYISAFLQLIWSITGPALDGPVRKK